jgi:predicted transcriptional regulator
MTELIDHGLLEYAIPDKPGSKPKRYRTTEKGIEFLRRSIE